MKLLEDLFIQELSEAYDAEKQITKALPKMAGVAHRSELRSAFETHLKQTQRHVDRLEKIFKALGREPESFDSSPISQIIKQGDELGSKKQADRAVLDAALITTAQKVEHYEIALYGSATSHAKTLGYAKIADLLAETLDEEEQTDALLTQIATSHVNTEAARAPYAQARTGPRSGEESGMGMGSLIMGALVGAAVALLYAPKTGDSLRKQLREKSEDLRSSAEDLIERGRQSINDQRNKVSETVDAGTQAVRDNLNR